MEKFFVYEEKKFLLIRLGGFFVSVWLRKATSLKVLSVKQNKIPFLFESVELLCAQNFDHQKSQFLDENTFIWGNFRDNETGLMLKSFQIKILHFGTLELNLFVSSLRIRSGHKSFMIQIKVVNDIRPDINCTLSLSLSKTFPRLKWAFHLHIYLTWTEKLEYEIAWTEHLQQNRPEICKFKVDNSINLFQMCSLKRKTSLMTC